MDETEDVVALLNRKSDDSHDSTNAGVVAQSDISEVLAVTAAAVSALDTAPSSRGKEVMVEVKSSADSAKGDSVATEEMKNVNSAKQTVSSPEGSQKQGDTSNSSTASEILIRSTVVEAEGDGKSLLDASSVSGQSVHDSFFNQNSKRVKVSSKRLREIKSPFDSDMNSTLDTTAGRKDSGEYIPPPLFQKPENLPKKSKKSGGLVQGQLGGQGRRAEGASHPPVWKRSNVSIECHVTGRDTTGMSAPASDVDGAAAMSEMSTTSSRTRGPPTMMDTGINYTCDTHMADVSSASGGSSQPEIVEIPETIVTIHAQTSVSPSSASSVSEGSSLGVQIQRRHQKNMRSLAQGAPVTGATASSGVKNEDVTISKFSHGGKERKAREALARRREEGNPLKKVVKPTFVGAEESQPVKPSEPSHDVRVTESITAAVAASAAVAITQPYMKAQQELESKMSEVLEKLSDFSGKKQSRTPEDNRRVLALERQLNDLTQKRLDFVEQMQQQQLDWQSRMMKYPRNTPCNYPHRPEQTPSNYSRPQDPHRKHYQPAAQVQDHKQGVRFSPESRPGDEDLRKGSPLDTPAPRMRPPMPTTYEDSGYKGKSVDPRQEKPRGILAEILAAHEDTPERDVDRKRPEFSPPTSDVVKPAGPMVRDQKEILGHVVPAKTTSLLETPKIKLHEKLHPDEPAALDRYLVRPNTIPTSPYTSLNDITRQQNTEQGKSSVLDAEVILKRIQANRSCLEANLDMILRAQQDADVYSLIDDLARDSNVAERSRIKKMVDEMINAAKPEIQVEVEKDLAKLDAAKKEQVMEKEPVRGKTGPQVRGQVRGKGRIQARVDTGLRKKELQAEEEKKAKKTIGKENVPKKAKEPPKKKKSAPPYKDETYMTRVYGKAIYQSHRTTVKDPYLHYANPVSPRTRGAPRPTSVAEVRATEVKSSKVQTEPPRPKSQPTFPSKQFYFNPSTGAAQPAQRVAPLPAEGHLIPMAIPLGPPRQGGQPVPVMTAPRSPKRVALITAKAPEPEVQEPKEKTDHLEKIVLPSVDIDSLPPTSPMQIESTPIAGPRERSTLMDESSIMDDQLGEGLVLPGYRQRQGRYHGPEFPPKAPQEEDNMHHIIRERPNVVLQEITSDVIAGDIRRRDMLERNAVDWIEQELMARIITEFHDRQQEPAQDPTARQDETASTVSDVPSGIAETIGQGGLQLFVDAGLPVDETLVNDLVKEVLLEKIAGMMGQRTADQDEQAKRPQPTPRHPRPQAAAARQEELDEDAEEYVYYPQMNVPTPEQTPRPSPIHSSPPQIMSAPMTPLMTPDPSIGESETESAVELAAIWGKHPVVGPQETDNEDYSFRDELNTPVATPMSPTPPLSRGETPDYVKTPPCDKATSPILLPPSTPPTPTPEEPPRSPTPPPPKSPSPEPVEEPEEEIEARAPTPPIPPRRHRTPTPPAPESETETESTTIITTETINESISEGEWLISRSEGQAAGIEIDPARRGLIAQLMRGAEDSSIAASDLEPDDQYDLPVDRSAGEFTTPKHRPERDPVLHLLSKMNLQDSEAHSYHSGAVPQPHPSGFPQPSFSRGQVPYHIVEKSLGEISIAQPRFEQGDDVVFGQSHSTATVRPRVHPAPSQGEIVFPRGNHGDDLNRSRSLKLSDLRMSEGELAAKIPSLHLIPSAQSTPATDIPERRHRQPTEVEVKSASPEPPQDLGASGARVIHVRSSITDSPEATQERPTSPRERPTSPTDRRVAEEMPGKASSEGDVLRATAGSSHGLGTYGTMSEGMRTGTFTPDQLNMDALLQSGYLTQTITDSDAGQSSKFGATFDRSGELDPARLMASGTLGQSTSLGQFTTSLGRTDEEAESSVPSERPAPGPRVVNVTMPTAQDTESETVEDVSEISLGKNDW